MYSPRYSRGGRRGRRLPSPPGGPGDVATDTGVVDDGRTVAAVDIVAGIVTFIALIFVTAAGRRDVIRALAGASITTVVSTVAVVVHAAVVVSSRELYKKLC